MRICSTRMTEVTAAIAGTGSSPQRDRHWRAGSSIGSNGSEDVTRPTASHTAQADRSHADAHHVIAYGCRIGSERRFRRWAALGLSRVMRPEDLSALAEETSPLAEAWDEIIAAMRERPDCEAVVLGEEDVEIADPGFAAAAMRCLREPRAGMVTACDGAVVVLARSALPHVRLDDGSAASAAELGQRATAQLRAHGLGTQELGVACNRPGAPRAPRPAPATGATLCTICGEPLPVAAAGDGHA